MGVGTARVADGPLDKRIATSISDALALLLLVPRLSTRRRSGGATAIRMIHVDN
jgi:hypothetical protein